MVVYLYEELVVLTIPLCRKNIDCAGSTFPMGILDTVLKRSKNDHLPYTIKIHTLSVTQEARFKLGCRMPTTRLDSSSVAGCLYGRENTGNL